MRDIFVNSGFAPLLNIMLLDRKLAAEHVDLPATSPAVDDKGEGLLTLKAAAALPELGGVISIKSIRGAIARGDISAIQPAGPKGSVFVTRQAVLDWIERCLAQPNHHASTSGPHASKPAKSARAAPGSFSTAEKKSALAAALKTATALQRR